MNLLVSFRIIFANSTKIFSCSWSTFACWLLSWFSSFSWSFCRLRSTSTRATASLASTVCFYSEIIHWIFTEWTRWSACSKECRDPNDAEPPLRFRKVRPERIVQARGTYKDTAPCPENLKDLVDYAPCNTHLCPQKLSSFKYTETDYYDSNGTCYRIRKIPKADMLINIDTSNLTKGCNEAKEA
jgi:hypothetical protein